MYKRIYIFFLIIIVTTPNNTRIVVGAAAVIHRYFTKTCQRTGRSDKLILIIVSRRRANTISRAKLTDAAAWCTHPPPLPRPPIVNSTHRGRRVDGRTRSGTRAQHWKTCYERNRRACCAYLRTGVVYI